MRILASTVRTAAVGRWEMIFSALAGGALTKAITATSREGRDWHVPCPIHGGKDGFRFFDDWRETGAAICNTCGCFKDGFALLMAIRKEGFKEVLMAVAGVLGLTTYEAVRALHVEVKPKEPVHVPTLEELENTLERKAVKALWDSAIPFTHENSTRIAPLKKYLESRGLSFHEIPEIRFLPRAKTVSQGKTVFFPCMLGAIRDLEGNLVSLHRTFLTEDGKKAPIEVQKKIMHLSKMDSISGCAIRFGNPKRVLAIAEGIETALSVVKATGFACWSCISAGGFKSVRIPKSVKTVIIFEDKDASGTGQRAGRELKKRLEQEGLTVHIAEPSMPLTEGVKSVDFNDIWQVLGRDGFPFVRMKNHCS